MEVKLIKIVKEIDNNNFKTHLCDYHKTETLLMNPQENTTLILDQGRFFISGIIQNLKDKEIILFNNIDIPYQSNYKGEMFEKLNNKLEGEGWRRVNFRATHVS